MIRINNLCIRLLTVGCVALLAMTAYADSYSVSSKIHGYSGGAFGAHITESTETLKTDTPKFDTSFGTLQKVSLMFDFDGLAFVQMQHHDDEGNPVNGLSGYFNYTTSVTALLLPNAFEGPIIPGIQGSISAENSFVGSTPGAALNFSDTYSGIYTYASTDAALLAAVSDTNPFEWWFDVLVGSSFSAGLDGYQPNDFDTYPVEASTDVTMTITYTYLAANAPEPGTFTLLGAGLGMVGLVARRRKK